jgi:hypothetical protein
MRVLDIRPALYGSGKVVAFIDIEITEHLRLFNLELRKGPDGKMRTFASNAFGKHTASFHPELATQITAAAVASLKGGNSAHDRYAA